MYGLRNLNELAADDAAVEAEIGDGERRFALHQYAADWDARVEAMEDRVNVRALVICAPIAIVAIATLIVMWG